MDYQTWIDNIDGMAGIYSFDILPDGSFSEIHLMAVNRQNMFILKLRPDAPDFYPGIHYRNYWQDINFEDFVYKCASSNTPLYSYVNAHGPWLKGFYIPISEPGTVFAEIAAANEDGKQRTVSCSFMPSSVLTASWTAIFSISEFSMGAVSTCGSVYCLISAINRFVEIVGRYEHLTDITPEQMHELIARKRSLSYRIEVDRPRFFAQQRAARPINNSPPSRAAPHFGWVFVCSFKRAVPPRVIGIITIESAA